MLRVLGVDNHPQVKHMFRGLRNQVVIGSVIEGNTRGDIYVNDLDNPTFVVLWDKMYAILMDGELNEEHIRSFSNLVSTVFIPDANKSVL